MEDRDHNPPPYPDRDSDAPLAWVIAVAAIIITVLVNHFAR
jgi:hypothetical protein